MEPKAKYKIGQFVYSHKNKDFKCEIISVDRRDFKGEFLTFMYELKMPFAVRDSIIVNEGKISTKKIN